MITTKRFNKTFFSILMFALTVVTHSAFPQSLKTNENPPNILFIAVDDLKPTLGCYGDTLAKTPNIDALANSGITFMLNYCQQAVCAPSRASLLTGQYPDQLKVWDLQTVIRDLNPGIITLPQYFKNNGYQTAATGKIFDPRSLEGSWGGPHDAPSWSIDYSYPGDFYNSEYGSPEYYYASDVARDTIGKLQREAESKGYTSYNDIRNYVKDYYWPPVEKAEVPYDAYIDGALTNHGISLMETLASGNNPFFLAVGFNRPHLPFNAPTKYWNLYARDNFRKAEFQERAENSPDLAYHNSGELRNGYTGVPGGNFPTDYQKELIHGYYAATSYIDAMVGKLLQKLDDLGLSDNTIVVLWGDHGWHLGDHSLWCKHSNFENAVKAPLIMKLPSQLTKGGKHYGPTEFTDIAPTLCSLAGLKIPVYFEGEDLSPLFNEPGLDLRTAAFSQYPRNGKEFMGYSVRTKRYRYTKWVETATGETHATELYDYKIDSLETISFINDPGYNNIINNLDSIVNDRIAIPSTQPKLHFQVYGQTGEDNIYPLANSRVKLDGFENVTNDTGQITLTHPEGIYNYNVTKQGYAGVSKSISVIRDTIITDTLAALKNQVQIKIIDKDTDESVDSCYVVFGKDTVPYSSVNLLQYSKVYSGFYDVTVKKKHYDIFEEKMNVYSDSIIEIRLKKKRYVAHFQVIDSITSSKLSGVEITFNDNALTTDLNGTTTSKLSHDQYALSFTKNQYKSLSDTVWLISDTSLNYSLLKILGDVTFKIMNGETPVNDVNVVLNQDTAITNNLGMITFTDLEFDTTYGFELSKEKHIYQNDTFFFTNDTTISVQFIKTALNREVMHSNVRIYPNPVKNRVFFETASNPEYIAIRNTLGRIVYKTNHPGSIFHADVSELPNGIYVVKIFFDKNRYYSQIISKQ